MSEQLQEKFRRLPDEVPMPVPPDVTQIKRRGARRRFLSLGGSVLAVVVIFGSGLWMFNVAGLRGAEPGPAGPGLPASGDSVSTASPSPTEEDSQNGWTRHDDGEWGVALQTPQSWQVSWSEYKSVAVANYSFETDGYCEAQGALTNLPSDGAFFWMFEAPDGSGWNFNGRPNDFEIDPETLASYETLGCQDSYRVIFEDNNRFFVINVAFGHDASDGFREQTMEVLDTLEIEQEN